MLSVISDHTDRIIQSMGLEPRSIRPTSLNFSLKVAPKSWKAYTYDTYIPIYKIIAPGGKAIDIRNFINGIQTNNYIVIAKLDGFDMLCLSRLKKGEQPKIFLLKSEKDYDTVVNVFRKQNFISDELSAHVAVDASIELLKSGAERYFVNRGLFSSYYLTERLDKALIKRKREPWKEAASFFSKFSKGLATSSTDAPRILNSLGFSVVNCNGEYLLNSTYGKIHAAAIIVDIDNFDIKSSNYKQIPSVQAVAALSRYPWVILTNGRLWRLYSSRGSSVSTNYFEVDIDGITDEKDPKLKYFTALFSASSLITKQDGVTDLDFIYNGGITYAKELEDDLRRKVFDKQLFLDLIRGILDHSTSKKYSDDELNEAKKKALKLLYRLLFILHAESRMLLPVTHLGYKDISFGNIRDRLAAMEKQQSSGSAWEALRLLFTAISNGNPDANIPQYNGALFEFDKSVDDLDISNKYLIPALRALTEIDGKAIDYQNFGVRQLGSLYEALLEYSVRQADTDLVIVKDEILDFSFASDLKTKPSRVIDKGDLYLSVGGLARKGSGSYYTTEKIVKFLVQKGLEPIFKDKEKKFTEALTIWRNTKTEEAADECTKHLLNIQVVDPAMGSGHFLVTTVDEITRWIMAILEKYPDAPLIKKIEEDRSKIISGQKTNGINLDEELLTFNVILKRKVMKRCIFGVDINPLAVELAKLSLWLDSFTIGTPLTFLDHHIRCGDSLIGLWINNLKITKPGNATLDPWTNDMKSIGDLLHNASNPADLTITEVKKSKESYLEFQERSKPLKVLLDMKAAGLIDADLEVQFPRNLGLIEENVKKDRLKYVPWSTPILRALKYADKYHFFHWELEFPDAYTDERRGFDLVIMNPPWDAMRLYDDDFFSEYDPSFRRKATKIEKESLKKKLLENNSIAAHYNCALQEVKDKIRFFKTSAQYVKRSSKGIAFDLWALFLDRGMKLVAKGGILSVVVPSGLINNEGATELRKIILDKKIRCLYEFENRKGIFADVHRSYKFATLVVDNVNMVTEFECAFNLYEIDSLFGNVEQQKFIMMTGDFIKLVSPATLSIPEMRNHKEIQIFEKLYHNHPLLRDDMNNSLNFIIMRELNRTESEKLFRLDGKGWPLIEGKNFHQYIYDYEKPTFTILPDDGLIQTSKIAEYKPLNKEIHEVCRLIFRDVAASTNVRGMICCIIPKHTFVTNTAPIILPRFNGKLQLTNDYFKIIIYLAGIFNSTVFDFLIRRRITMHLNFFYIEQTPIPRILDDNISNEIINISARLSCTNNELTDLVKVIGTNCGTICLKERIELTARLDALVAHIYGLTRQEYEYIINTFDAFEEDEKIGDLTEIKWTDALIRKFNGEVRKRVLKYYDRITQENLLQKNGVHRKHD